MGVARSKVGGWQIMGRFVRMFDVGLRAIEGTGG